MAPGEESNASDAVVLSLDAADDGASPDAGADDSVELAEEEEAYVAQAIADSKLGLPSKTIFARNQTPRAARNAGL